jgi:hypothetical protein
LRRVFNTWKYLCLVKLRRLKGLAHDLAHHLEFEIWIQRIEVPGNAFDTNILERKNSFDEYCVHFFQKRLPESFDFSRVEKIAVRVNRRGRVLHVAVDVRVDGRMFFSDAFTESIDEPPPERSFLEIAKNDFRGLLQKTRRGCFPSWTVVVDVTLLRGTDITLF